MNPYISPVEQHVGYLKEEMQTTLEQVKALENIISPGEIMVYEADQLRELYIIKFKCGI